MVGAGSPPSEPPTSVTSRRWMRGIMASSDVCAHPISFFLHPSGSCTRTPTLCTSSGLALLLVYLPTHVRRIGCEFSPTGMCILTLRANSRWHNQEEEVGHCGVGLEGYSLSYFLSCLVLPDPSRCEQAASFLQSSQEPLQPHAPPPHTTGSTPKPRVRIQPF